MLVHMYFRAKVEQRPVVRSRDACSSTVGFLANRALKLLNACVHMVYVLSFCHAPSMLDGVRVFLRSSFCHVPSMLDGLLRLCAMKPDPPIVHGPVELTGGVVSPFGHFEQIPVRVLSQ